MASPSHSHKHKQQEQARFETGDFGA